jgi:hypothetical protein
MNLSVCLVCSDYSKLTKLCIENLQKKTNVNLKLYILDNASIDTEFSEYLKGLCEKNNWFYFYQNTPENLSFCYNILLKNLDEEMACFFPINCFVNQYWAEDLIHNYHLCSNPGILGIRNGGENVKLEPLLYSCEIKGDYFQNVWLENDMLMEGLIYFNKTKVGFVNENIDLVGVEFFEYSCRFILNGYLNFYIPKQTCFKIDYPSQILFPMKTTLAIKNFKKEVNRMVKTNK